MTILRHKQPSKLLEVVRKKAPKFQARPKDSDDLDGHRESSPAVILRKNDFSSSTKLNALSEDLRKWDELTLVKG
jgi:DNA repair protein RAD5